MKIQTGIFTIHKIPFSDIEKCGVSLKDKNKGYTLKKHAMEQGWDIAVNGAMFDMRTYQNVTDLITGGIVNNGGNYSDVGLAFGNDFPEVGAYRSKTELSKGKPVDFIGGAPTLLVDGKIVIDMKGIEKGFDTRLTQRTAIGVDKSNLYILSTLSNKSNLKDVANALLAQGCLNAINLDGGGSTSLCENGRVLRAGRNIPSAFGVKLKSSPTPTKKKLVVIDSGHSELTAGKRSLDGSLMEYEFNLDVSNRIARLLKSKGVDAKIVQVKNANSAAELKERCKIANGLKADILVSIHANAFSKETANGWEIFCYKMQGESKKLADCIHAESIPFLNITDRGIKDGSNLAMVRDTNMPAVLIEHGFYTNTKELALLKSDLYRQQCAIADTKGILKYLGIRG